MGPFVFAFRKKIKKCLTLFMLIFVLFDFVVAEGGSFSWDFSDCEIKDILFAVSVDTGISIVPDDTVSGKGDLKFAGKDFDSAFETFLKSNRLFVRRESTVWTVSRISVSRENDSFSLEAFDLFPVQIVEKLSEVMDRVVTFETLPSYRISVHFKGVSESVLMESLAKRFGEYEVVLNDAGYHFEKKGVSAGLYEKAFSNGMVKVEPDVDGKIWVDIQDASFAEVLEKLFGLSEVYGKPASYCLLSGADVRLQRSVFVGVNFADVLSTLCSQFGFGYVLQNNLYYIFSDSACREELLSGKRSWRKYSLQFTRSQDFFSILSKVLPKVETLALPDDFSFLSCASDEEARVIESLICDSDIKQGTYVVSLKFLKPAVFLEHLPPAVDRASLFMADDSENLYFKGTEEAYKNLCEQLELCDRPAQRITYDLLILQYDESLQNSWMSNFEIKRTRAGEGTKASAVLGSVMGFNLNVVSSFGLSFAAELQSSIEENRTRVFADTTLHGLSGQQINFQNTNTYRYRDNNVDPATGLPVYSGVTREITSGIKLDVVGWVSGEGLITSKVTASVSRRGNDTSALTGNPPPTSEKVITTEVCGKSGEPLVLSGLVQSADSQQEKRSPVISKIPLLGNLFKGKSITQENTQVVIYLVPHVETAGFAGNKTNGGSQNAALHDDKWVMNHFVRLSKINNQKKRSLENE